MVVQVLHMEPVTAPGMTQICFTLCDLVGMMREDIVDTAAAWEIGDYHEDIAQLVSDEEPGQIRDRGFLRQ